MEGFAREKKVKRKKKKEKESKTLSSRREA